MGGMVQQHCIVCELCSQISIIILQGMLTLLRGVGVVMKMLMRTLLMRCLQKYLVLTGEALCLTTLW